MARKRKKKDSLLLRIMLGVGCGVLLCALMAVIFYPRGEQPSATTKPAPPTVAPNPYDAADFAYNGLFLECLAGESRPGIDVSSHQGRIDWPRVREAGVEFVFVRLGYRGYETGVLHEDVYARTNLAEARKAGLQVGAYFFSQALNEQEARDEAAFALKVLDGFVLDLPLVYDWEYVSEEARTGKTTKQELMACVNAYCGAVEQAGYAPMVYFNRYLAQSHLELEKLTQYPFWLAMYTDQMTYQYRVDFWQYSDKGRIPGIEADVDLNIWMMDA